MKKNLHGNRYHAVASDGAVDWDHPLNSNPQGKRTGWWYTPPGIPSAGRRLLNLADSKGQTNGVFTGFGVAAPAWLSTSRGDSGPSCTATTMYIDSMGCPDSLLGLTTGTLAFWQRKRDTTLRGSSAFADTIDAAGVKRVNVHLPYSDGTVYWDWGGFVSGTTRLAVSGLTFDTLWHRWVFAVGGGLGMRMYRDGVLVGSNAATPTRTADATNVCQLNNGTGPGNAGDIADYSDVVTATWAWPQSLVTMDLQMSKVGYCAPDSPLRWVSTRTWFVPTAAARSLFRQNELAGIGSGGSFYQNPLG